MLSPRLESRILKRKLLMIVVPNVFELKFGKAREALAGMKEGRLLRNVPSATRRNFRRVSRQMSQALFTRSSWNSRRTNLAALEAEIPRIFGDKDFQTNYQEMAPLVESGYREIVG